MTNQSPLGWGWGLHERQNKKHCFSSKSKSSEGNVSLRLQPWELPAQDVTMLLPHEQSLPENKKKQRLTAA